MLKRGVGTRDGADVSRERSEALHALETSLADLPFPISRTDLLRRAGSQPAIVLPYGEAWTLEDALKGVPVTDFSSPHHVAEVIRLRLEDFADIYRPGGTDTAREPLAPKEGGVAR